MTPLYETRTRFRDQNSRPAWTAEDIWDAYYGCPDGLRRWLESDVTHTHKQKSQRLASKLYSPSGGECRPGVYEVALFIAHLWRIL